MRRTIATPDNGVYTEPLLRDARGKRIYRTGLYRGEPLLVVYSSTAKAGSVRRTDIPRSLDGTPLCDNAAPRVRLREFRHAHPGFDLGPALRGEATQGFGYTLNAATLVDPVQSGKKRTVQFALPHLLVFMTLDALGIAPVDAQGRPHVLVYPKHRDFVQPLLKRALVVYLDDLLHERRYERALLAYACVNPKYEERVIVSHVRPGAGMPLSCHLALRPSIWELVDDAAMRVRDVLVWSHNQYAPPDYQWRSTNGTGRTAFMAALLALVLCNDTFREACSYAHASESGQMTNVKVLRHALDNERATARRLTGGRAVIRAS